MRIILLHYALSRDDIYTHPYHIIGTEHYLSSSSIALTNALTYQGWLAVYMTQNLGTAWTDITQHLEATVLVDCSDD